MRTIKFILPVIAMLLLQSCNMVAQNVTPQTNQWAFVYVAEDKGRLLDLYNSAMKDIENLAYTDANGDFVADLRKGKSLGVSTTMEDYSKTHYLLDVTPCHPDGSLIYGYTTIKLAVSFAAVYRMASQAQYNAPFGPISVAQGSTWYTNQISGFSTGLMDPKRDPRFGTYYVRN